MPLKATKFRTSSELENFTTLQMWGDQICKKGNWYPRE
jgi:hypothetical protein